MEIALTAARYGDRAYALFFVLFRGQPGALVDVVILQRIINVVCFCDLAEGIEWDGLARESV